MRFVLFTTVLAYLLTNSAMAEESSSDQAPATYKIKQVIADQNLVIVETSNPSEIFNSGKIFLVTFQNEKQCSLTLKETKGSLLTLSSSSCAQSQDITRNLPIEPALVDGFTTKTIEKEEVLPVSSSEMDAPSPLENKNIGISLYYSLANEVHFDDAFVSTTSGSGKVEATYKTANSVGLGVTWAKMKPQSWGFLGNLVYEPGREINSVTFKGPGGTATANATGTKPKVSFLIIEGNAVYRWNSFYLPFGLNVNAPTLSDTDGANVDISGGLGIFLGGGFILGDNSSVEIFVRTISMNMTESSGTTHINYELGTMTGVGFGYKYWF